MTPYQENRLSVYKGRIERIKKVSAYLKIRVYFYAAMGIMISFITPYYSHKGKSIIDMVGGSYQKAFMCSIAVVFGFIIIGAIVFHFQDKNRIKKLQKMIKAIEDEITQAEEVQ